ncbi:hypothetical protein DJ69_04235 [Halorubrum persicum]|uniref:Uncharacterized protein n=1 Tax=Halorubrum persicum TaxID=1383844 RepID=A0A2G1WL60_9EURY|nr:hypothetical protein [Halorubrum persicum]PHQ39738.1 hypothetical protein DJ69_04235 [Halorubrum persicum]
MVTIRTNLWFVIYNHYKQFRSGDSALDRGAGATAESVRDAREAVEAGAVRDAIDAMSTESETGARFGELA